MPHGDFTTSRERVQRVSRELAEIRSVFQGIRHRARIVLRIVLDQRDQRAIERVRKNLSES